MVIVLAILLYIVSMFVGLIIFAKKYGDDKKDYKPKDIMLLVGIQHLLWAITVIIVYREII